MSDRRLQDLPEAGENTNHPARHLVLDQNERGDEPPVNLWHGVYLIVVLHDFVFLNNFRWFFRHPERENMVPNPPLNHGGGVILRRRIVRRDAIDIVPHNAQEVENDPDVIAEEEENQDDAPLLVLLSDDGEEVEDEENEEEVEEVEDEGDGEEVEDEQEN